MLEPGLFREVAIEIIRRANLENVDKIVTPTAMGTHISTAISLMMGIPLVIICKREYGLSSEVLLRQQTGYSEGDIFINGVSEGDRVLVFNDMLLAGGTVEAVLNAFDHIGAGVVDTVAIIKKTGPNEFDDSDHHAKTLINVTVEDGEIVIVDEYGDD